MGAMEPTGVWEVDLAHGDVRERAGTLSLEADALVFRAEADGAELDAREVAEAPLVAQAADDRHLTALELGADRAAGLLTLATATGVRALARGLAATDALFGVLRAG